MENTAQPEVGGTPEVPKVPEPTELKVTEAPQAPTQPAAPVAADSGPAVVGSQPDPAVSSNPGISGPAIADDVDVIEKEWVDKATEVVKQTAGDPYKEEEQVESLQIDYLKKRYGKEIKKPKQT